MHTNLTQRIFTKTKTKIEKEGKNCIVYEVGCLGANDSECCPMVNIGETKRALEIRLSEGKNDRKNQKKTTAVEQHIIETGRTADFDAEKQHNKRLTLECLRIQQKGNNAMNFKEDTDDIYYHYSAALS